MSYLSPYFDPNKYWIFSLFGVFYPLFLLSNIVMILLWIFIEYKKMFYSLVVVLLGATHFLGFINFSKIIKNNNEQKITIMSYNVKQLYNLKGRNKKSRKQRRKQFKSFLNDNNNVDVFCIQESSKLTKELLVEVFPKYHTHKQTKRGTYLISKFPIVNSGEVDFGTITNSCIWADVVIKKDTLRIYSAHLQSNGVSTTAEHVIIDADLQNKKTWNGIKNILLKYSKTSKRRAKQAKKVRTHALKSPYPTLMCTDLNDPPTSYTYNMLCGDFQDSFMEAGSGIGTTYAGIIPLLRIDYIFASKNFEVKSYKVIKNSFSDHYPIVGSYSLIPD